MAHLRLGLVFLKSGQAWMLQPDTARPMITPTASTHMLNYHQSSHFEDLSVKATSKYQNVFLRSHFEGLGCTM